MRILFVRPCCIGDAVLATAALSALRDAYPDAHITWAVGGWSKQAVAYHPAVDAILDTGNAANPLKSPYGFLRFLSKVIIGRYDIVVSLVRSPLMSLALLLSGIPDRAGFDSNGRGFGYTLAVPIAPDETQHEAKLYLSVVAALGAATSGYRANLPVLDSARETVAALRQKHAIHDPFIIINPAGGSNPGMVMTAKRWPPHYFAEVADTLAIEEGAQIVLIAGPDDAPLVQATQNALHTRATAFVGDLTFPEIGALAAESLLYIGNDTGLTHLAAASGAKTAMIVGPSDPNRYSPYTDHSIALWKKVYLPAGGVANAANIDWDWKRDGISPEEAVTYLRAFLHPVEAPVDE